MNLEKLAKELRILTYLDCKENETLEQKSIRIAHHVALMVLEARKSDLIWSLDPSENQTNMNDPYVIIEDRIRELESEIAKLKKVAS